jgi:hypothetical protein
MAVLSRLLSSSAIRQPDSFSHDPALIAVLTMIVCVIFPASSQEHEPALHLDPTVRALVLALMLTQQFARRVPGVVR